MLVLQARTDSQYSHIHHRPIPRIHWQSTYDLSLYTLNLSTDNDPISIVPTHAAPHHSLWGRAFELQNPHTSPPSFARQSHIVFLWCLECHCSAAKQLLDHRTYATDLATFVNNRKRVQKPHGPSTEVAIRSLQCMQFKGMGRRYYSVNSLMHPPPLSLASGIQYIPGSRYKQTILTVTLHFWNMEV